MGQIILGENLDVLPTLCEWMGIEVPLQCDGRALQPFVHDAEDTRRAPDADHTAGPSRAGLPGDTATLRTCSSPRSGGFR